MSFVCMVLGIVYLCGNYGVGKALAICGIISFICDVVVKVCEGINKQKNK